MARQRRAVLIDLIAAPTAPQDLWPSTIRSGVSDGIFETRDHIVVNEQVAACALSKAYGRDERPAACDPGVGSAL